MPCCKKCATPPEDIPVMKLESGFGSTEMLESNTYGKLGLENPGFENMNASDFEINATPQCLKTDSKTDEKAI